MNGSKGIIHIGANKGQEAEEYSPRDVLWIEPIPCIFEILKKTISKYDNQIAINSLVTDKDDVEYDFHIASNSNHQSSSILDLKLHKKIWPKIHYIETIKLNSKTLPTIIKNNDIDISKYDTIVLDTQGSELLILKASISILKKIRHIVLEVADFESYKDCCTVKDIENFFSSVGFERKRLTPFKRRSNLTYYEAEYINMEI